MYDFKLSYYMHWIRIKAAHKLSREPLVLDLSVSEDVLQTLLEDYIVCSLRAERHIFKDVYSFACLWNLQMWRVLQSCVKLNSSLAQRASSLKLFSFAFITNTSSQRGTADMILKSPFSFSSETSCDASFIKASRGHREGHARSSLQNAKANIMLERRRGK